MYWYDQQNKITVTFLTASDLQKILYFAKVGVEHFTFIPKHLGSFHLIHFHKSQATTHVWSMVMALILTLKALVDVSHAWFTTYNNELLLWVIYHVKIKHMVNICRSQKPWSLMSNTCPTLNFFSLWRNLVQNCQSRWMVILRQWEVPLEPDSSF